MDKKSSFETGISFSKQDFLELKRKMPSELSSGFNLTDMVLNCVQSDRQRVKYARQLFSKNTSTNLRNLFPDNPIKNAMADLIDTVDEVCNMFTSRKILDEDKQKCALGVYLDKQIPALKKLHYYMDTMRFDGKKLPFQTAIKMAINTAIKLQEQLKNEYGIHWLMLSRIVQDHMENCFSVIRGTLGPECRPPPLDCRKRIDHILVGQFLSDPYINIHELKEEFESQENEGKSCQFFDIFFTLLKKL